MYQDILNFVILVLVVGGLYGVFIAIGIILILRFCNKDAADKFEEKGWYKLIGVCSIFGTIYAYFYHYTKL